MVNGKVHRNARTALPRRYVGPRVPLGTRRGGWREAYDLSLRRTALAMHDARLLGIPAIIQAQNFRQFPSKRTLRRYRQRLNLLGHIQAFRRNGGPRKRVLSGLDLVLLAIYVKRFPSASQMEKACFLYEAYGQ